MYRPPARQPKGRWAAFLHRERKRRGWSQQRAFEELRDGLGLGAKSRASYAAIDMGEREPKPHEVEFLVRYFGSTPDDEPEPEPVEFPPEIRALVEELRADHEFQRELLDALRELARSIAQGRQPNE